MAISSIGVGSGLPLDELLINLRAAENAPLVLIKNRAEAVQNRISGYGAIKNALESFQAAANALGKTESLSAHATQVRGEGFTASASASATTGTYRITVNQLATYQTLTSQGLESRSRVLSAQDITLSITLGTDTEPRTLSISNDATSLQGLVTAINGEPGLGVRATLLNDGSSQPYRLLLTATESGNAGAVQMISVDGTDSGSDIAQLLTYDSGNPGLDGGLTQTTQGRAALLDIDGIAITAQGNTVENVIEGVTLQLTNAAPGAPATLSVTRDEAASIKAIETFVSSYNNLQNVIKGLTTYNADSQSSSALTGDSLARRVQTQMRDTLNIGLDSGEIRTLSQMGITTDPNNGTLLLDNKKLSAAVGDHQHAVKQLFAGPDGISGRVAQAADLYLRRDGIINTATGSMASTLKDLDSQYDITSDRIDDKIENYRRQFIQLDTIIAQMSSVSNYLSQQLSRLGNLNKNSQ